MKADGSAAGDPRPWIPPLPTPFELATGSGAGLAAALSAPVMRGVVRRGFASLFGAPSKDAIVREDPGSGAGWFAPDSVAWRVHADAAVLVAMNTAFALQALHPRAMAAVWDHSGFGGDFFGRTRRTGEFVLGVVYEPSEASERRCAELRKLHDRIVGHTPDGRPYAANDPELLEWVHVAEYLAIAAANRRFAAHPMNRAELDQYVAEVARVGEEVGVIDAPRSWEELIAAFRRHRPNLALGEQAAAAVEFLEGPPMLPALARPVWRALWAGAVVCLPPVGRTLMRTVEPPLVEVAACRAVVRSFGRFLGDPFQLRLARQRLGQPAG